MGNITKIVDGKQYIVGLRSAVTRAEELIDFSKEENNVASADVVAVMKIPANSIVLKVGLYVITAEGSSVTCSVGRADAADFGNASANGWDASANLNSAGLYISTEGTDTYGAGKAETVDTYITITPNAALDAAKIVVFAEILTLDSDLA